MVAIGVPAIVLIYCLATFDFDRELYAINLEIFPPGMFERGASVNFDPVHAEIIRSALNSLRIFSFTSAFARFGTNCALCLRFYQLAGVAQDPAKQIRRMYPKHRPSAIAFVCVVFAIIVFVEESVRTSAMACRPHLECVQHARRWLLLRDNDLTQCPCLKLISVHPGVKTYDEWLNPPDIFDRLAQLATLGDLQMVNVANRRLLTLPKELQGCKKLHYLYVCN